jgi:signal transduction histidine kinase/putative methionine-R-sulfoxide reductase with GAF domain
MARHEPPLEPPGRLLLHDFVRERRAHIQEQWERAVRLLPCTRGLPYPRLGGHLPLLLERVAERVAVPRHGERRELAEIPELHSLERMDLGHDLEEVSGEYSALRASILRLYVEHVERTSPGELAVVLGELEHFNEAFDELMAAAISRHAGARERTFLALERISRAALGTEELDTFLPKLLHVMLEATAAVDSVTLMLREGEVLRARASVGMEVLVDSGFSVRLGEGFCGRIASERRPMELRSAATAPQVKTAAFRIQGTRGLYGVPLIQGEEVLGVALMGSRSAFEFSSEDKLLFQSMVSRATTLIFQAQLAARERQAREQVERALAKLGEQESRTARLQEVTAALSQALTTQQVAEVVVEKAVRAVGASGGSLGLLSEDGRWFDLLETTGYSEEEVRDWTHFPSDTPVPYSHVVGTGRPVFHESLEAFLTEYPQWRSLPEVEEYGAFACLPLLVEGRVIGAIGLSFRPRHPFSEEERAWMMVLAGQCAQALERGRLYDERKRAEEQLRRTAEFRERFLGIVSHDLRNPLNAIRLSAIALLRSDDLAERHVRGVRRIVSSAERMKRMISDLLDFTRGRLGEGIPVGSSPVDLAVLGREVVEELEAGHPGREVMLEVEGDLRGEWDADRLSQLLINLGKNALDYSPEETPVRLALHGEDEAVRLEVHNQGPPIPPERLESIFEPFRRFAPDRGFSSSCSGLGLGLYIVDQIVRAHGGSLSVRSNAEEGTTFTVWLPRRVGGPPREACRPAGASP